MHALQPGQAGAIGIKLKTVRKQRRMSLRDLAAKADISASMLSQIETGKAYPSVRSIYSIAAALAVPVDYFFPDRADNNPEAAEPSAEAIGDMTASELREAAMEWPAANGSGDGAAPRAQPAAPVVHAESRPTIELKGGVKWARLTALAESGAEFLQITYEPGSSSGNHMSHHAGREFGLILAGELTVELAFDLYTLKPGDSIIFDSETPHRLSNKTSEQTCALWVVFSPA